MAGNLQMLYNPIRDASTLSFTPIEESAPARCVCLQRIGLSVATAAFRKVHRAFITMVWSYSYLQDPSAADRPRRFTVLLARPHHPSYTWGAAILKVLLFGPLINSIKLPLVRRG